MWLLDREARTKLSKRPWRVDDFDEFSKAWFAPTAGAQGEGVPKAMPFRRVMMFVDNAGRRPFPSQIKTSVLSKDLLA